MAAGDIEYATKSAYEALVESFIDAADKAACGFVKAMPILASFKREKDGTVAFNSCLYLQDWGQKEQVDILVRAQERILRGAPPVLVKSTVRVSYFRTEQERAVLLQSIHFDYGVEQDCHAVFHAQLCPEAVQLSSEEVALEFCFPQEFPHAICCKNARIPTSDMTFSSVLLCLAADHMSPEFFREFLAAVRDIHEKMPLPPFKNLQKSIAKEPGHLRSFHWFSHMEEPST
jgi:hypothetical protein